MVPWGWGEERAVKKIEAEKHQENWVYKFRERFWGESGFYIYNGEIFCVGAR